MYMVVQIEFRLSVEYGLMLYSDMNWIDVILFSWTRCIQICIELKEFDLLQVALIGLCTSQSKG